MPRHAHLNFALLLVLCVLGLATAAAYATDPEIVGGTQYSNRVQQALHLLATRDPDTYAIVTNNIGRIHESEHSGMRAPETPPTYDMSDVTANYSVTWCAATIAHDSYHSKLYHDYLKTHTGPVPEDVWTGTHAEQECMQHQLAVMQHIGCPAAEINWAKTQADGHYINDPNNGGDYNHRKW